jgi:hypothetical protein
MPLKEFYRKCLPVLNRHERRIARIKSAAVRKSEYFTRRSGNLF